MYICICNALREKQLAAASNGAVAVSDVFRRCGARPKCGKCLPDVAQLIQRARDEEEGVMRLAAE